MNKPATEKKQQVCKRCNSNLTTDIICPSCKNELLSTFDSKLDWQTAYEIEKVQRAASRYVDKLED
jgi:hypothetical protein